MRRIQRFLIAGGVLLAASESGLAAESCPKLAGRFVAVQGQVEVGRGGYADWQSGSLDQALCEGDTIRVGPRSRASVSLVNNAVLCVGENSALRLIDIAGVTQQDRSWIELVKGALQSFSRKPRVLTVNTPYLNGSIEGTEFVLRVDDGSTRLTVMEGTVVAANEQGKVPVPAGQTATAVPGQAPKQQINIHPRNDAHWALYYPPVLAAADTAGASAAVREAADRLQVGQANAARRLLEPIGDADPAAAHALALRAVIAIVQNDPQTARALAGRAAKLRDIPTTALALSYVQQAEFEIDAAYATLTAAVAHFPDEALLWARLGELALMRGDRTEALAAAHRAEALAPDLPRTQLVRGFAALAAHQTTEARTAFQRAIAADSAEPLGHFGLGLTLVSDGDLVAGRGEIETAAGLDGSNALLRAYLGKAYGAEGRPPLDAQQYAIARELDPNDPTPWFYEGLMLQAQNRPVEAVAALEESRRRNDNRAVYRSRQLLDQDQAARGASQARAYSDLGFEPLAIETASASLTLDPANAAAHRFLADSYQEVRRREISRVSELLQSQLLQEITLNPIQASSGEANLNLPAAGGPASAGFNEFNALFQRNQTHGALTAWGGTQSSLGGEALAAGQFGPWSVAAGAFAYDTDGWRPNSGLNHQVYSVLAQWAVDPRLNLQLELRHRESREGDLAFNFDPEDFIADKTVRREQDLARIGLRYSPGPATHLLFSYLHIERQETLNQFEALGPFSFDTRVRQRDIGNQYEAQMIQQWDRVNLIAGGAYTATDRHENASLLIGMPFPPFSDLQGGTAETEYRQPRAYAYLNLQPRDDTQLTLGLSGDQYEESALRISSVNPKIGVRWQALPGLQVRAAAFKVVKPSLATNRTLEPTQVAGFNQFYDDINGTKSWRYAAGADWRLSPRFSGGMEVSARQLEEPIFDGTAGQWQREDRHEQLHRLFALWTPTERLALRADLSYDRYRGLGSLDPDLPAKVDTVSLPIGLRYFHPSGFFAGAKVTAVRQRVSRSVDSFKASGEDTFTVADALLGYRLAGGRASASVAVLNLFDTQFRYQDDSYREFRDEPSTGPYFPVRTVQFRVTVSF